MLAQKMERARLDNDSAELFQLDMPEDSDESTRAVITPTASLEDTDGATVIQAPYAVRRVSRDSQDDSDEAWGQFLDLECEDAESALTRYTDRAAAAGVHRRAAAARAPLLLEEKHCVLSIACLYRNSPRVLGARAKELVRSRCLAHPGVTAGPRPIFSHLIPARAVARRPAVSEGSRRALE